MKRAWTSLLLCSSLVLLLPWWSACGNDKGGCETDDDCFEGWVCDTFEGRNQCFDPRCEDHSSCPEGWLCAGDGSCYDPYNGHDSDCRPLRPGCLCAPNDLGLSINCDPPEQAEGVDKSCHQGTSECDGERYGTCSDTYPADCDNIHFGTGDFHPTDDNSSNVTTGVEGEIILDPDERTIDFGYLWIANTGENTVSKIDVDTGFEVARYAAVREDPGFDVGQIPYPATEPGDCQHCPSRTAIDFNGDAYVANRAFGRQGTVTKFANDEVNCVDRDGNGIIDTSYDANDDGFIDIDDPNEFLGLNDECILWSAPVGGNDGVPRALAIDSGSVPDYGAYGNVWVGLYKERKAAMLNGDDGTFVTDVSLESGGQYVRPYGAAIDGMGFAWFTAVHEGTLAKVDTIGGQLVAIYDKAPATGCTEAYGIAIDVKGRIWLGGWSCNTANRFDPADESWAVIDFAGTGRGDSTRGIAPDLQGTVWVAHTAGHVSRFDAETLTEIESFEIPHHLGTGDNVSATIGVGIDRNGACWTVSRNNDYAAGTATRILPGGQMESFPVGLYPYTYSDFTGFGMLTVTRPSGWYNMVIAGCEDHDPLPPDIITDWQRLTWTETEPPNTNVRMRLRVADTVADLYTADWFGPYDDPDVDLDAEGVPDSNFMLVQVLLSSGDPVNVPAFLGFDVDFHCYDPTTPN